MPEINVFLLCSLADARFLKPHAATIGSVLRQATANVLTDLTGPEQVAFRIYPSFAENNAPGFQILCIASQSDERMGKIIDWRWALAEAWASLADFPEMRVIAHIFREKVEVYPNMSLGSWGLYENGLLFG